jgi:predicted nucleotidyltransferase
VDPASILFGRTRRRVLGWLLGHPDEAYYLRQIVRHTGAAVGAVQRELAQLTAAGLVLRSVKGRQVYFQADAEAAIFPELQGLFAKTAGLADVIREALIQLDERVLVAFIFGSAARGELRGSSDVDLVVIGEASFQEVVQALQGAQERLGREINPTVYPPSEVRTKLRARHHFLSAVLSEPRIYIIGADDELVGLGAKWLVGEASDKPKRNPGIVAGRRARSGRQRS